jgi:excisionase family DNA binding protein
MEKLLLTVEEAAEALSIGRSKLYELVASGSLRSVRIDKCRRVPLSAVVEFIDQLEGGGPAGPKLDVTPEI